MNTLMIIFTVCLFVLIASLFCKKKFDEPVYTADDFFRDIFSSDDLDLYEPFDITERYKNDITHPMNPWYPIIFENNNMDDQLEN